jgi:putative membrane protein
MLSNGFLGYPTTFMLDFVVCALAMIVPLLLWSLWLVKFRCRYLAHKRLQISLGLILLLAVTAFEVDVQMVHGGWESIVARQQLGAELLTAKINAVRPWLLVHLVFAVTTPLLWIVTITLALMRFENPPAPGPHSRLHKILGWASTLDITLTSVTGLWFYYIAFVKP